MCLWFLVSDRLIYFLSVRNPSSICQYASWALIDPQVLFFVDIENLKIYICCSEIWKAEEGWPGCTGLPSLQTSHSVQGIRLHSLLTSNSSSRYWTPLITNFSLSQVTGLHLLQTSHSVQVTGLHLLLTSNLVQGSGLPQLLTSNSG